MSISLMTKVWDSELPTHTHKFILLAFADHANDDGLCWPSLARIAERSQISRRQAQRIVADLKKLGLLRVVEKHSQHKTPMYEIRGDKLTPLPIPEVTSATSRGDISVSEVTNATPEVTPMSPKPSYRTIIKESSEESSEEILSDLEISLRKNYAQSQKSSGARKGA